jgi:alpha-galactosidase
MLLSGDDLTKISVDRLAMLRKLQPPTGEAARFDDDSFRVGRIKNGKREMVCLLNFGETPQTMSFKLTRSSRITDFWSGESLGSDEAVFTVRDLPKHSARLLVCS